MDPEIVERIADSTGLTPGEAARVVADVLAWHGEPLETYVRRRHAELHLIGTRNAEIFTRISAELDTRLVRPPEVTERQLRRIVYG